MINCTFPRSKQLWSVQDIWHKRTTRCFKAVDHSAVYKNPLPRFKDNLFISNPADYFSRFNPCPFNLIMPVPFNITLTNFIDIIQIIFKRKLRRSVFTYFPQCFICYYLCYLHFYYTFCVLKILYYVSVIFVKTSTSLI